MIYLSVVAFLLLASYDVIYVITRAKDEDGYPLNRFKPPPPSNFK